MPRAEQVYHKRELEKGFYCAQAVKAGNTLYVSGCVSWDAAGNVIGAGDMRAQVHKENVFTTDMDSLEAHNDLRIKFYVDDGSAPPASTWIGCTGLALPGLMLEVECVAVLG